MGFLNSIFVFGFGIPRGRGGADSPPRKLEFSRSVGTRVLSRSGAIHATHIGRQWTVIEPALGRKIIVRCENSNLPLLLRLGIVEFCAAFPFACIFLSLLLFFLRWGRGGTPSQDAIRTLYFLPVLDGEK